MPSEEKEKTFSSDEIDLVAFFAHLRRFVRLSIVPMILFGVIGLFAGWLLIRKSSPVYTSKMIMQVGVLNKEETQALADSWKNMLVNNEHKELSAILHCSTDLLKQVSTLSASIIPQSTLANEKHIGLVLTASVRDSSIFPALQQALIAGFDKNPFISKQILQQQKQLTGLINRIDAEIRDLDSLKKVNSGINGPITSFRNQYPNSISTINRDIVELSEKKLRHENALRNAVAANVVQGFADAPMAVQNNIVKGLIKYLLAGLVIGFIVGAFRFLRIRYPMLFSTKQALVRK